MEYQVLHPLLSLGLLLLAGYLAGLAANYLNLPRISGYLAAGILLSPSVSGILNRPQVEELFAVVSALALAVIAYAIGGSLKISRLVALEKVILWINLTEGLGALLFTSLALLLASPFLHDLRTENTAELVSTILLMGSIAVATAPAATMAVIHELRAEGPVTTTLLGVVALDDALSILLFSGAVVLSGNLLGIGEVAGFGQGLLEVAGALAIGGAGGLGLAALSAVRKRPAISLVANLGMIFFVYGAAAQLELSPLLACMAAGFVVSNRLPHSEDIFHELENVEESLYCLFFSMAGAHFNLAVLHTSALFGFILLAGRFLGKLIGVNIGARLSHASPAIRRYLGLTLLPQAGLSLGLIFLARPFLAAASFDILLNALLASIIINEIISPPVVKWALTRVGESNKE